MKKIFLGLSILVVTLSGCGLLPGSNGGAENNDKEYPATSGKFLFLDEEKNITNHYFIFDGSKDVMSFSYYENDIKKYETNLTNAKNALKDSKELYEKYENIKNPDFAMLRLLLICYNKIIIFYTCSRSTT